MERVNRRQFLRLSGLCSVVGMGGLAGCSSTSSSPSQCSGNQITDIGPVAVGADAPNVVEVFSDYACPHCATFALSEVPDIVSELVETGKIIFVHRDYPLPISQWSWLVPNVARAVLRAGGIDAYFTFNEIVYQNQDQFSNDTLVSAAAEVGLEKSRAKTVLSEQPFCQVIKKDRQRAKEFGIEGTPTAVVNSSTIIKGPTLGKIERTIS